MATLCIRSSKVTSVRSGFGARVRLGADRSVAALRARRVTPATSRSEFFVAASSADNKLCYDDLVNYISAGCKPKEKWRIGTEHEKFPFLLEDCRPAGYDKIKLLLEGLRDRFDWTPIMENGYMIGVQQNGQSVTLEPGGQFELSGAPLESLHLTCSEVNSHLYQVKSIAEEIGVAFLGCGFQPKWSVEDTPVMPKGRYAIMKKYMPTVGSMGLDMMFRTCTVQVNLDFESEQDMVEKFRIGLALQPVITALFAASPFKDGKPNGMVSYRSHVWTDTDNARTGDLPWVFEEGMGFARYVDWVLDVPMYFVYRDGQYLNAIGMSFRDFMAGELPLLPGEYPTLQDWENHLSTVFPEVRMKKFLEMRGADSGPFRRICALPAFWVGLLYDDQAQKEALELLLLASTAKQGINETDWSHDPDPWEKEKFISLSCPKKQIADWTEQERRDLKAGVSTHGLRTKFRDGTVQDLALKCLKIAEGGLMRRGSNEQTFLKELQVIAETGVSPADWMLEKYNGDWNGSVDGAYLDLQY